jgi:hypothetical protein
MINALTVSVPPSSNLPAYLSAHSFITWCGPCKHPVAQYMKNGVSGSKGLCLCS